MKSPQVLQQRWRQDNTGVSPPRAVGTAAASTTNSVLKRVRSTPCSLQLTPRSLGRGDAAGNASFASAVVAAAVSSRREQHGRLSEWTVEQVACWAQLTPLPAGVAELLRDSAVNGQVLQSLSEEDLQAMGLSKFGWRRQLLLCREELEQQLQGQEDSNEGDEEASCIRTGTSHGAVAGRASAPVTPLGSNRRLQPESTAAAVAAVGPPWQQSTHRTAREQSPASSRDEHKVAFGLAEPSHLLGGASKNTRAFLVDNSVLQSEQEGLEFHNVPDFAGGSCQVCVPWGTVIHGTPLGNDWLQVGEYFLPMHLNGVTVLTRERRCLPTGSSSHVAAATPQCGGSSRARSKTSAMPLQHGNGSGSVSSVRGSSLTMAAPLSSGKAPSAPKRVGSSAVVMRSRMQSPTAAVRGHGGTVYCATRLSLRQCVSSTVASRPILPAMIPTPARAVASRMAPTLPYTVANPVVAIESGP